MSRTNDVTADVLMRRCEELRRQRDAAVKDNQRLRAAHDAVYAQTVLLDSDLFAHLPFFLRRQAE